MNTRLDIYVYFRKPVHCFADTRIPDIAEVAIMRSKTPKDRRMTRTSQALKEAFLKLAESHTVASITINDIACSAGYSRGAFYKQYRNKQDFLHSIVLNEAEIYIEKSCRIFTNPDSTYEKTLENAGIDLFTNIYINRQVYRLIFTDTLFPDSRNLFCQTVRQGVMELFTDSEYNDASYVHPDLYICANSSWYFSVIDWWIEHDFELSPTSIYEQQYFCKHKRLTINGPYSKRRDSK